MTFLDWFLIQAPTLQAAFFGKGAFALILAMFLAMSGNNRWVVALVLYGLSSATIASFLPGEREAKAIIALQHGQADR